MENVVSFLKAKCKGGSRLHPNNRLLFAFEIIDILVHFETNEYSEELYRNISEYEPIDPTLATHLENSNINSITLTIFQLSKDTKGLHARARTYSTSRILFYFLSKFPAFSNTLVDEYWFEEIENHLDGLNLGFHNIVSHFTFKIRLNQAFNRNLPFFKFLLETDKHAPTSKLLPNEEYLPYYEKRLHPDSDIRILVTNTKVRRLGYFKLIVSLVERHKYLDKVVIYKKFEEIASQFNKQLSTYKNTKGLIKTTKTGNSAKPYIELAEDIGFLTYLNKTYSIGKFFKVYSQLQRELIHLTSNEKFNETRKNIFALEDLDRLFFLEEILKNDFFYISSLLEIIFIQKKITENELRKVEENERCYFQNFILKKLDDLLNSLPHQKTREIRKIKLRIEGWEKPKVYLEHVLMPRLNWLFDLGLIDMSKTSEIFISNYGENLFSHLNSWYDIARGRISSPSTFLDNFYMFLYDDVYYQSRREISGNLPERRIETYLEDCFKHFQTLAPNRVTSSQAITYIRYKFYLTDKTIIEHSRIEKYLREEQENYIFTYHKQYKDGYIQKAN